MHESIHRGNLALRFLLEMAALVALGYWGWRTHTGGFRLVWTIGSPLVVAVVWGVFRVPGDPGPAPVAVSGPVRLLLEAVLFGLAVVALVAVGRSPVALVFGLFLAGHYYIDRRRVQRFLRDT